MRLQLGVDLAKQFGAQFTLRTNWSFRKGLKEMSGCYCPDKPGLLRWFNL
jgi:hypothetical protein